MSAQDNTEKVLRQLHLLFAKAESYPGNDRYIVVEAWKAQKILNDLSNCMNELLEEYELTVEDRQAAERQAKKEGKEIIEEAKLRADDVYAASVLYSNEAMTELWNTIHASSQAMEEIYSDIERRLKVQERTIRKNQSELKAHLREMEDTDKYMRLVDEENRRIEAERRERERIIDEEPPVYRDKDPEVKVNKEILSKMGIAPVEDPVEEVKTLLEEDMRESTSSAVPAAEEISLKASTEKIAEESTEESTEEMAAAADDENENTTVAEVSSEENTVSEEEDDNSQNSEETEQEEEASVKLDDILNASRGNLLDNSDPAADLPDGDLVTLNLNNKSESWKESMPEVKPKKTIFSFRKK